MALNRRTFLKGLGVAAATTTLSPLIKVKRASAVVKGSGVRAD